MGSEAAMSTKAIAPSLVRYSPSSTWLLFPLIVSSEVIVDDLGPMVYGCLYCPRSYQTSLSTISFADSKTLKEEKREELFESLKVNESIGWALDVIDPPELSSKMLRRNKVNLNEISHDSSIGLVRRVMEMGVLLTEVYVDTVGDAEEYRAKLSERFSSVKFVVSKKADSLYPVVSEASIVAKVTRDRALRVWLLDETSEKIERNFGSGYPAGVLEKRNRQVFGFLTLVRFGWGTCKPFFNDSIEVTWEADQADEDEFDGSRKRQVKLSSLGFTPKWKIEETESSGKGRCKFLQSRRLRAANSILTRG